MYVLRVLILLHIATKRKENIKKCLKNHKSLLTEEIKGVIVMVSKLDTNGGEKVE